MRCLNDTECGEWLRHHRIPIEPYGATWEPGCFERLPQIGQVKLHRHRTSLFRRILGVIGIENEALLHCTDWGMYTPDEMSIIRAVRVGCGEHRELIEAPGHLFSKDESDLVLGMLSLIKYFEWTAYFYADRGTTLLVWEGEAL